MIEVLKRLGYYPRFCVWELTLACDLRCQHCGSFAGKPRADELTGPEALDVARQLADMHCERLTLSGGEPTLRADWDCIARELTSRGVRVNIITNGWSWTPEHTSRAMDAGLENAAFSLDGPEAVHDRVRARQGSYQRVMAAIDDCTRRGFAASVVTHVNALNQHMLPEFRQTLHEHGVRSWQIQIGNPAGTMASHRDLVFHENDLLWLVPQLAEMKVSGPKRPTIYASDNVGYYGKFERTLRDRGASICFWIGCRAGCQVVGIESNGNVKGCLSLPSAMHAIDEFVEGNLRANTLQHIWNRKGAFSFNRDYDVSQLEGFCGTCRFNDICRGGCSWSAYCRSGSRFDNPLCFYRVAVQNERWDLIDDAEIDQARERGADVSQPDATFDPGDSVPLG
jgi:radical SAM protein with 4Fe4S-binding SPASM domain